MAATNASKGTRWILGVDGGGTKTNAVLLSHEGDLAAEAAAGPSNVQLVGNGEAARIVIQLARECCAKVGCRLTDLQAVGIGLAGLGRETDRAQFRERLLAADRRPKVLPSNLLIETDVRAALEGALPTCSGIVLIAGTGSIAMARNDDGSVLRVGGWGRALGDEGSGFAIAREAIRFALRMHEHRGEATSLLQSVQEHFGVTSVEEVVSIVQCGTADVAALAPSVIDAAKSGDRIAHSILFEAAGELAELVRALVLRVRPKRKVPVVLMGGMLEAESAYSKIVKERVARSLPQVVVQKPKFPPAYGAAILAFRPFEFVR
jgi:N-acetylglucosamine kinase